MDASQLLISSLGLQDVVVEKIEFSTDNLTATITARQMREKAKCPRCHGKLYGVKQWYRRELRGPPLGPITEVTIIFHQLQGACGQCRAHRLAYAPFIHPRFKQLTTAFVETAGRLMEEITCEAVGRLLRYDSRPLWALDQWRMEKMKPLLKPLTEKLDVKLASADEVHMRTIKPKNTSGIRTNGRRSSSPIWSATTTQK